MLTLVRMLTAPTASETAADWRTDAACRGADTNVWYPIRGQWDQHRLPEPVQICRACPVQCDCLAVALTTHEVYGIWGGTSEHVRRRLRAGRPKPGRGCVLCGDPADGPYCAQHTAAMAAASERAERARERICIQCSRLFRPNRANQEVCSDDCRRDRKKARRVCDVADGDTRCVWCGTDWPTARARRIHERSHDSDEETP